ncbi:MAG: SDR family NAD(P)-dependent oxidoreductase [Patescibacteria group bacterium]|nr:SDR family NAD(P)-dependent oxidoreductase [Patescibacteria group bacterium]
MKATESSLIVVSSDGQNSEAKQMILDHKVVLISGGTGSLGSSLVKKLLQTNVKKIIVYSRDEYKQSELREELNDKRVIFFLGDITNIGRLKEACENVDIIIHTAAFKRVDQAAHNYFIMANTNINGTNNIITAGKKCEKIIFVGTDKSFKPTTIYGASKMIAESLVLAAGNGIVWRFGNFIKSRGSVWEIFEKQKARGEPFTITDPRCTRFVIDINDVCDYVLSDVKNGFIYRPKKLKTMTVMEIAQSIDPNHPYLITGLRNEEKISDGFSDDVQSDSKVA